jgi:hypothetical protein
MIVYIDKNNRLCVYIHIPKNSGKHIRKKIISENTIIKSFWDIGDIDLAHIPFMLRSKYIEDPDIQYYYSYSRNPYQRLISAYFYLNPKKNYYNFIDFCKNKLPKYNFNLSFHKDYIHYYPQYLFVCDDTFKVSIDVDKLEDLQYEGFNLKKYNLLLYYNNETLQIVNNIYSKDFELFGYKKITNIYQNILYILFILFIIILLFYYLFI